MIEIFNTRWNIILTDVKRDLLLDGTLCKGVVRFKENALYIDKSITSTQLERLIPHELTHIVLYVTQVRRLDTFTEEDICEFISIYGSYILKLSKQVIKKIKMMLDI